MFEPLTKRQKQILDFLKEFNQKQGYSPSLEEIRDEFKLKAISTVHEHIHNLQKKGYLNKEINQARGISVKSFSNVTDNCIRISNLGEFIDGKKVNSRNTLDDLLMSKSLFNKNSEYFFLIAKDSISNKISNGDLLIIEKLKDIEYGSMNLVKINKSQNIYLRVPEKQKYRIKLDSLDSRIKTRYEKNVIGIGKVTMIIKQFD